MTEENEKIEDSLNIGRPFVEESETPLIAIYEFERVKEDSYLRDVSGGIIDGIREEDIVIGDCDIKHMGDSSFVILSLSKSNTNISEIADLSNIGSNFSKFEDFVISTVPPRMITRYKN